MKFLKPGVDLQSVLTDAGELGRYYYVSEKKPDGPEPDLSGYACERIIVAIENGSLAPIPFAVCIDFDGTVRLVNLTAALEVELLDKVIKDSDIALPPGIVAGPGHPAFEKPN